MVLMQVSNQALIAAVLVGIAVIVLLITVAKMHAFLALTIGSLIVGAIGGLGLSGMLKSFTTGVGSTVASVGVLIALGAIVGKILADSGGADAVVDKLVGDGRNTKSLPWKLALVGALIGLPMFFEIGLVLLIPVIVLASRRSKLPIMKVGIPALAGLSTMHALVPPHPGPLAAIGQLRADLGITLGLGVLVAIPTIAISGPVFAQLAARWVPKGAPALFVSAAEKESADIKPSKDALADPDEMERFDASHVIPSKAHPSFIVTILTILLPVVLMMGKSGADIMLKSGNSLRRTLDFVGEPLMALLITALVALFTLGMGAKMSYKSIMDVVGAALPPIAGILLIVGAGGGFKQVLVDTGVGKMLGEAIKGSPVPVLLLAWLIAVLIRLATGSATVATITAAGIVAPVVAVDMSPFQVACVVLAIGCGSVFLSHVNDAGFWLVKEYYGLTVGENLKTWSLMETILSVVGVALVWVMSATGGALGW